MTTSCMEQNKQKKHYVINNTVVNKKIVHFSSLACYFYVMTFLDIYQQNNKKPPFSPS